MIGLSVASKLLKSFLLSYEKYGKGFSTTNLWYFRQFYVVYSNREPKIRHKACGELISGEKLHKPCGVLGDLSLAVEKSED